MVTDDVIQLPTKVWQRIVQLGVERHIQELEAQLEEAKQQIAGFERKYRANNSSQQSRKV